MIYEFNQSAEKVDVQKSNKANDRLLADSGILFEQAGSQQSRKQNMVNDFGIIEQLNLSEKWKVQPKNDTAIGKQSSVDFQTEEKAILSFREKGSRISEIAGKRFVEALNKPLTGKSRVLNIATEDGQKEYEGLKPVMADDLISSNTFKVESAKISQLNGRNVLEIIGTKGNLSAEGKWISSNIKIATMYIDKFGKGEAIQEIRLEAESKNFSELKTDLDHSLTMIKWNERNSK